LIVFVFLQKNKMLEKFIELSERNIALTTTAYARDQISVFNQNDRMIGLKGSRGVGKTTLLLQYAKLHLSGKNRLYISLDNPYFTKAKLPELIDDFVKNGGDYLLLDEVHHYPNWSSVLKHSYDNYTDLKILFTGSSILQLTKGRADLSRRALLHTLQGLSLREYINITENININALTLIDILKNHTELSSQMLTLFKPIQKYKEYVQYGYYPFFLENTESYPLKLIEIINQVLEADLPQAAKINVTGIKKMKHLLQVISESVPFKPNLEKISGHIEISKNTLKDYLHYLEEAMLVFLLSSGKNLKAQLSKPEKIYLHHPNLMHAFAHDNSNVGNIRESFFLNQLSFLYKIYYSELGDFLVDSKYVFEIGGKNKTYKQIAKHPNSFIASDDIEIGYKNTIPLWLFGFLY